MTKVLLTVDTELLGRHHAAGASWQENLERSYDAAGVGVPYQLEMLGAHGLKACFFVDPMPALVYGLDPVKRMVEPILEAGQEVQLHLHPLWATIDEPAEDRKFELTDFGREGQRDLISKAHELLVQAGAPEPIAFRSGSYAVDTNTLRALADLGFRFDSSHNGSHHPWPSALPLDPGLIDPAEAFGIVEVPVTQIATAGGGFRHFQLCALSAGEMRAALNHAAERRHPVVTIVSHSFELASRDGLRANGLIKRRFEQLCRFLADNRERLPTAHFTQLGDSVEAVASTPLPARRWREARRMAEQAWGNACYEGAGPLAQLRALASART